MYYNPFSEAFFRPGKEFDEFNENTSPERLTDLAQHSNEGVRRVVAFNPNLPVKSLKRLASDKDVYVRRNVASNPFLPLKELTKLSEDKDAAVRCFASIFLEKRQ